MLYKCTLFTQETFLDWHFKYKSFTLKNNAVLMHRYFGSHFMNCTLSQKCLTVKICCLHAQRHLRNLFLCCITENFHTVPKYYRPLDFYFSYCIVFLLQNIYCINVLSSYNKMSKLTFLVLYIYYI